MENRPYISMLIASSLACCAMGAQPSEVTTGNGGLEMGTLRGKPTLIRKIDLGEFGGQVMRFGDLTGNGVADFIVLQSHKQNITCVTALELDGKRLWQRGKEDIKHWWLSSDIAVQIYDWDNDGNNEVLLIEEKTLRILDGATGEVKTEKEVPANDSLLIANFSGGARPNDLMIKDRYDNIWVYDKNLKLLWHKTVNTGHFPMNIDVDGDGRDELLCGYTLFSPEGEVLWDHQGTLKQHNDAVDADDMDGDGKVEFAIAASGPGILLSADGTILWRKDLGHAQHAAIGNFVPGKPGKEVAFVARSPHRGTFGDSREGGAVYCYSKAGEELWHTQPQGWLTMACTIDGWTGADESFVLLYRRKFGPPVMLDGEGKIAAEFPFPIPPLDSVRSGMYPQYFIQHFDAMGDSREEVFVYDAKKLWVYENAAPAPAGLSKPNRVPDPRIYNASFYTGWQ